MKRTSIAAIAAVVCLAASVAADPKPNRVALAQARVDAAALVFPHLVETDDKSVASTDAICAWSERWYLAQRDQPLKGAALAAAADAHVTRLDAVAKHVEALIKMDVMDPIASKIVAYYQAEAAVWAAQAHGVKP